MPHQKQTYLFRARSFIAKHGVLLVVKVQSVRKYGALQYLEHPLPLETG